MTGQDARSEKDRRQAQIARISGRLHYLDDVTLAELDRLLVEEVPKPEGGDPAPTTRRQFLKTAAAGGAVVVMTSGLAAWELSHAHLQTRALKELLSLYERLDQTELDDRLSTALARLEGFVVNLESIVDSLRSGLEAGRARLSEIEAHLPSLRDAYRWLSHSATTLSQRMLALENAARDLLGLSLPLPDLLAELVEWLLEQLPPSAAEAGQEALERTSEAVSAAADLRDGLHGQALEPMSKWLDSQPYDGEESETVVLDLSSLFDPAERALDASAQLSQTWEESLAPLEQTLEKRRRIREQIRQHRQRHGL